MPVTRPLLSCSPFLSFQSAFRASGQSCAQCPWFLHNLHSVQPEKSCSPLAHSCAVCAASRAALICTTASCISLSLFQRLALRVLVRPAAVVLDGEHLRSGRISMHPAGLLGRCVFGGADLTVFSCGKHKHTVGQSVLVVQTHTNRLSHFSFFLPANFLHLLFSFLLTFCTCFFPFLLTFCTCFFFPSC